jgi:hypothetical protein
MYRAAVLITVVLFAAIMRLSSTPSHPASVMVLKADRCGGCNNAPIGTAVMLIDVHEYSSDAQFEVELVDHRGRHVDSGQGLTLSALTIIYPCPQISKGRYYLRLSENGALRREFAINVV